MPQEPHLGQPTNPSPQLLLRNRLCCERPCARPPVSPKSSNQVATALFINGVFREVLEEIIESQETLGSAINYLQPHKGQTIRMLKKQPPTLKKPVTLYLSTTDDLDHICYAAEIVDWKDKRTISSAERAKVTKQLERFQPGETTLFTAEEEIGKIAINLLRLRNLEACVTLLPTSCLRKTSDGLPLKPRTRSGGWSEVFSIGKISTSKVALMEQFENDLASRLEQSFQIPSEVRDQRLKDAPRFPEKIQLISTGFRRNPDVIIAVLERARGVCEMCKSPAPFIRRRDGTPFLEVHHWTPLAEGGEDTVENAAGLCPNCHRKAHFG